MVGNMIPFLQMPNGGSIELELIPLMIASYHLGWKYGALCGLASFLLTIVLGFPMYFVQPIQIVLDYVLPISIVGMVSLFKPFEHASKPVVVECSISYWAVCLCCCILLLRYESNGSSRWYRTSGA